MCVSSNLIETDYFVLYCRSLFSLANDVRSRLTRNGVEVNRFPIKVIVPASGASPCLSAAVSLNLQPNCEYL